jgi:predicted transcriptional regulator
MACISPDGQLSATAVSMLKFLSAPKTLEEIKTPFPRPTYILRSMLRELSQAGFVTENEDTFALTDKGKAKIG